MASKPIIGLTMGDPAGIGPEIILKALEQGKICRICCPIVIGDAQVLESNKKVGEFQSNLDIRPITTASQARCRHDAADVLDLNNVDLSRLEMGGPQAMGGRASYEYLAKAVELATKGEIDAITTAPLSKEALHMAGLVYPGHTEILAELTGATNFAMMFVARDYRVILVTIHTSLKRVCAQVTKEQVLTTITLADETLQRLGIKEPRIAVAGLNPHAGESGIFGNEEIEQITPAIRQARDAGLHVEGPFPADTIFYRAWIKKEFDIVVAMYHDQGCIPLKLMGFEVGVNLTLGLPVIRTSVDHGTAYGRAGKRLGTGDPTSLIEAVKIAVHLAGDRQ